MIADRCEVRKIGSQNAVDRRKEPIRVLRIVKVALVQDDTGSFGFDEIEDASEIRAVPAIADEGDFQVRVRGDRARRALCVALWEREREKGRQHCAPNEAGGSVGLQDIAMHSDFRHSDFPGCGFYKNLWKIRHQQSSKGLKRTLFAFS